ncbi:conserved Plasmodium protein, unknown function [Plasmodium sp. gorilla clade G2]|uniref:conserved Plasmodium protein, unknown function n=1 Tax=Plasmodium sp. gorilla clade G2 TaxID=880535 RepID=UPI000D221463|nr:conserved Plasmodium protein, unknown function [Plasmodium sp. gorilla clade G2]SOV13745.1 conserved Plasmodium protein, unknown function [Plasmodium sp. gorilla clade G2]
MKDNKIFKNNIFIYNDKVKELLYELIFITNNISLYRKKYIKYIRRKIDGDKYKCNNNNNDDDNYAFFFFKNHNYNNEFLIKKYVNFKEGKYRYISNEKYKKEYNSSFDMLEYYDKFINRLLYLCNNDTDIYIEFLYVLLINSQLYNRFLFLCTYIYGDKKDPFLYLIYNHFLILVEYYYYYKNSRYFDDIYNNLKNTYENIQTSDNNKKHYNEMKNKNGNHNKGNDNYFFCNRVLETSGVSPIQNFKNKDTDAYKTERVKFLYNFSKKRNENFFTINESNSTSDYSSESFSEYEELNNKENEQSVFFNKEENVYYVDEDKNGNNMLNGNNLLNGNTLLNDNILYDQNIEKKKKGKDTKNIFNKFLFNLSESQNSLRNLYQNFYSKNKNRLYDSQLIDNKKKNSLQNRCFFFSNANNFNIKQYYQLKHIFSIFKKLKIEHLYILLYFSLSILSTLFHIYLSRVMINKKNPFFISTYLFYLSKKVKNKIFNNLYKYIQHNKKEDTNKFVFQSDDIKKKKKKKKIINNNNNNNNNCDVHEKVIIDDDISINYLINKYKHNDDNQLINLCHKNKYDTTKDSVSLLNVLTSQDSLQNLNNMDVTHIINKFIKEKQNDKDNIDSFNNDIKMLHTLQLKDNFKKLNFQIINRKHENNILEECNGVLSNVINNEEYNNILDKKTDEKGDINEKRETKNLYNHYDDNGHDIDMSAQKNDCNDKNSEEYKKDDKSINKPFNMSQESMNNDTFYKFIKYHLQMKYIYFYYKNIEKEKLLNYVGFENLIKSLSIICNEHFFAFYMNKINMKNIYEENDNILNEAHNVNNYTIKTKMETNKQDEENNQNEYHDEENNIDTLHLNSIYKEPTLINNEYIKKKIKRNKLYTYKLFNNQIETLLNSKELMEYIKKQKETKNKKNKSQLENDDFLYIQTQNDNNIINNNDQHIYNDIFKFIQNKYYHNKNDDILHSNCSSYENSDSSDNLTLYNYNKNYYNQNNIILDSFLFFIINIFYTFLHFHNVYFSSPYLNLFLSFSIKLIYKYKNILQCQSNIKDKDISLDPPMLSPTKREDEANTNYGLRHQNNHSSNKPYSQIKPLGRKKNIQNICTLYNNSKNYIHNACSSKEIININDEPINVPNIIELIVKKQKFIKKKQKKNYSCIGNDIFLKDKTKDFLPNTFDIILNSFFDLCISICSMDFKYISQKKQKLNMSYFCNNIIFYHHIINKSYNDKDLDLFNRNNYNDSLESKMKKKKKKKKNPTNTTNNNNNDINDMIGMYKTNELSSNSSNILNENNLNKIKSKEKKKESNNKNENSNNSFDCIVNNNDADYNDNYNDNNSYNNSYNNSCNNSYNNSYSSSFSICSDESLNFLKYMKKKRTNRIYIDENNIINMLINIGCIFMNNIKYNAAITLNHIYKINQYNLLSDRQKFYNYIQKSFYNNKNITFPYIYNQYFISFFFFFKIHYLFFLIKYKCENEIFLKAYWFLHAVYNITQN